MWRNEVMKTLLIVTSSHFPYGGACANLLRLMGVGLTGNGWQVAVLIQRGLHTDNKKSIPPRSGSEQGVSYRYCGFRLRPENILFKLIDTLLGNLMTLVVIFNRKIKGQLDTVLVYNNSGIEKISIVVFCKILRIRVITYIPEWYEKASVVRRWMHHLKWWDFLFGMKFVNLRFDGLAMPSHFLFNYYKNEKRVPQSRLYILPNLVDLSFFEQAEADTEFQKKGVRIGYCGTPTRKDGAEDLIRAFQIVRTQEPSAELMIVGDSVGDKQLLPNLKRLAADLGVEGSIIFTGLVPFSRMPGLLRSCDLLALARPSGIFAEAGFPTKLGEYMACRKPVVLTRVGDLPRYLTHQKNAMLAEPDCPEDFAKQILWLIKHSGEAEAMADQGYRWATETLSHRDATATFSTFLQDCSVK
jgi:glycosyltransferase involved in cell wall biosynthesis